MSTCSFDQSVVICWILFGCSYGALLVWSVCEVCVAWMREGVCAHVDKGEKVEMLWETEVRANFSQQDR